MPREKTCRLAGHYILDNLIDFGKIFSFCLHPCMQENWYLTYILGNQELKWQIFHLTSWQWLRVETITLQLANGMTDIKKLKISFCLMCFLGCKGKVLKWGTSLPSLNQSFDWQTLFNGHGWQVETHRHYKGEDLRKAGSGEVGRQDDLPIKNE